MGKDEETVLCVRKKAAVVFGENHILEETEELIKIFVTSIETAEKKQKQSLKVWHRIFENK